MHWRCLSLPALSPLQRHIICKQFKSASHSKRAPPSRWNKRWRIRTGWAAPLAILDFIPGWIWLGIKTFLVVSIFIWVRASFPRYRYDQIMRLGWKVFIPLTVIYLVIVAVWMQTSWNIWK